MAHTETMLESKESCNGRVIRVTVDKVPASCLWTPTAA